VGTRCANHVTPLYPQKLALTSPTGGGRSVGMVRSRTKATEFLGLINNDFFFNGATPHRRPQPPLSGLHSDTPHSAELLWTSDQSNTEYSDNRQHSQQADIHDPGGVRTRNPNNRTTVDPRLTPRSHWDGLQCITIPYVNFPV